MEEAALRSGPKAMEQRVGDEDTAHGHPVWLQVEPAALAPTGAAAPHIDVRSHVRCVLQIPVLGPLYLRVQTTVLRFNYATLARYDVQHLSPSFHPNPTFLALHAISKTALNIPVAVWEPAATRQPGFHRATFTTYMEAYRSGYAC